MVTGSAESSPQAASAVIGAGTPRPTHAAYRHPAVTTGATGAPSAAATVRTAPSARPTASRPAPEARSTSPAAGPGSCSRAPGSSGSGICRPSTRRAESARSSTTGVSPTVVS